MRAYIIVDLGFGDAGKGLLTDYLVRKKNAGVVVRYNGGAQAGHNVMTQDGRHHTFAQFGSGSFVSGVRTFLSRHVLVHPGALLVEGRLLENEGVPDAFSRLRISDQALIITPFHQAANHIRELARGDNRHGSCGVGVGETYEDFLHKTGDSVHAGNLANPSNLRGKLSSIRERKRNELSTLIQNIPLEDQLADEWAIFEDNDVIDRWISSLDKIQNLGLVQPDEILREWLRQEECVVFEGAQGVLLDADAGFHPHTTWSNCTGRNAIDLVNEFSPEASICQLGVLRSHAVRHGNGPLPTETGDFATLIKDHNRFNDWQGNVRYGWFDAVLARYALEVAGQIDGLAITHMDAITGGNQWTYCDSYQNAPLVPGGGQDPEVARSVERSIGNPVSLTLEQKEKHTAILASVKPILQSCPPDESRVIETIESLLNHPVCLISRGPYANDVKDLNFIG